MIAFTLQVELDAIINTIAPKKWINFKKNYAPFLNEEIKNHIQSNHNLLTKAIKSKKQEDWRQFRHDRQITNKKIETAKTEYLKGKLGQSKEG